MATQRPKSQRLKQSRTRSRTHLALLLTGITGLSGLLGCRQLTNPPTFPSPMATVGRPTITGGFETTAARPAEVPMLAPANDPALNHTVAPPQAEPLQVAQIVRGQDNGFAVPAWNGTPSDAPADGGRHTREPMGVSGQPAAKVAQNPQSTSGTPVPGTDTLPAPSGTYTTPGVVAPNGNGTGYTGIVPSSPPSVYQPNGAQPSPSDIQPYDFDALPEIVGNDLSLANPGMAPGYTPRTQTADIIVNGYPARTGRIMFGGAVNSDAGVTGQVTIEERNFDISRFPSSFRDLVSGTAFRGAGQTFRIEAAPGSQIKRYAVSFSEPYLFGYMPISMSVSGSLFDRRYNDWDEERGGGKISFGYRITPDLSISAGLRAESIEISRPRINGIADLDSVLGTSALYSGQLRLTHDTRDSPFAPSEGHYLELTYEQAFGDYEFPRGEIALSKYFLLRQRADGSGRQTLTTGWSVGFSGEETPIFENFFAGGYTTLRGFEFRGASPTESGVQVGGRFQFLGTVEYMFPITADDMLRGVAFVDYGTVERDIEINKENFRVAPGFGLRVAVPALGPAPLAFDFAFPIEDAAGDQRQTFSFFMGLNRRF